MIKGSTSTLIQKDKVKELSYRKLSNSEKFNPILLKS